jgi:parvulin-like peptidyl-prolyl cis-trans isomerase-like protein
MKRLLREPLLHFLLLGAGLFLVYSLRQREVGAREPGRIVITLGEVERLATSFAKTWQRPPTPEELAGLVSDRVREEVYFREAMALGLDRDDTIIRRRLRQKMEFVSDDIAALVEPTEADLEEYLRTHPDSFRVEPRFTFLQVYFNPEKHDDLPGEVAQLLARLHQRDEEVDATALEDSALGDSTLLEAQFVGVPASEVAKQFGEPFALELGRLEPGRWQGPVESGFGVHLVFVSERAEGRQPALAEVRDDVRREWDNARRIAANEAFYRQLLARYRVTIEGVEPASEAR